MLGIQITTDAIPPNPDRKSDFVNRPTFRINQTHKHPGDYIFSAREFLGSSFLGVLMNAILLRLPSLRQYLSTHWVTRLDRSKFSDEVPSDTFELQR